jgi:probable rRNA maturation factor
MKNISFSFTNKTKQKIPSRYFLFGLENFLKKMNLSADEAEIKRSIEVNLILLGKKGIQSLNRKYRKKDKPTDVLSFPIDITNPNQLKDKNQKLILGDIYICPAEVPEGELQNTFLHGLIHLVGYDHEKDQKEWDKIEKMI